MAEGGQSLLCRRKDHGASQLHRAVPVRQIRGRVADKSHRNAHETDIVVRDQDAADTQTGVNLMAPGDTAAWNLNIGAIRRAAANRDVLIPYHHYQVDAAPGWQEAWASAAVDAGADLYVSHSEPLRAGIRDGRC